MYLNVQDIAQLSILKPATVKTGRDVLDQRTVEWVSVIEGPVENFVRENEFVLTTGIGCREDPEVLLEFVKDVYKSGASALAIATGRHVFDIPEPILRFAEEKKFIMIDIPWDIRFADIIQEVMVKLNHLKQEELNASKDIHQTLIDMILAGDTLDKLIGYIEAELRQPLLVLNKRGDPVAGSADIGRVFTLSKQLTAYQAEGEPPHPLEGKMRSARLEGEQLFHFPIQTNGMHEGDLFMLTPEDFQCGPLPLTIIEYTIIAIALWFSRNHVLKEAEYNRKNEFLLDLAKGKSLSDGYKSFRADSLHMDIHRPYECIVGYMENEGALMEQGTHAKPAWVEKMMPSIQEELVHLSTGFHRRMLVANDGRMLIIYLEHTERSTSDTANQLIDLVERRFHQLIPGAIFSWGIGKHNDGFMCFSQSFERAKAALDMGRKQRGIGQRFHFEETRMNRLLLNLSLNEEVQDVAISTIAPLLDYDRKREMDLIHTFTIYNKNGGNVSQTARELKLHRQSLLYRLRKIESLTGLTLIDPDALFLLEFSIKIWSTGRIPEEKLERFRNK